MKQHGKLSVSEEFVIKIWHAKGSCCMPPGLIRPQMSKISLQAVRFGMSWQCPLVQWSN